MTSEVMLREVLADDLPIFFEHQLDPTATRMAAFPSRDRNSFNVHWTKILADETIYKKTIMYDGQIAGNMVSWEQSGDREVGYWIGKEYWGKGIASRALSLFLNYVQGTTSLCPCCQTQYCIFPGLGKMWVQGCRR